MASLVFEQERGCPCAAGSWVAPAATADDRSCSCREALGLRRLFSGSTASRAADVNSGVREEDSRGFGLGLLGELTVLK